MKAASVVVGGTRIYPTDLIDVLVMLRCGEMASDGMRPPRR